MTDLHTLCASDLRDLLVSKKTSSVEIVRALHTRADHTEPHIHGFTTEFRNEALRDAERCDQERAQGTLRGPLHGLPITVKDNIDVAGSPSSVGLVHGGRKHPTKDAVLVQHARAQGAIILGKSNVPQGLLSMRCDNNLYGPTLNPWSKDHVSGGSSSGEGALVASGASIMGLGTDLGGSIRFPAAFCGVAGFKPTQDRWSNRGICTAIAGQEFVRAQVGPIARSTRDIALLLDTLPSTPQHRNDPRVPPIHPTPPKDPSRMTVGVLLDDGFISPSPSMQRAVQRAADIFKDLGARVVPFTPPHQKELVELYLNAVSSDGLDTLRSLFQNEPLTPSVRLMWLLGTLPNQVRSLAANALKHLGEDTLSLSLQSVGRKTTAQFWSLIDRRTTLMHSDCDAWNNAEIDILLSPACAVPAVPNGLESDASLVFSYFARYNIFGMPAGVVPVTRVLPNETTMPKGHDHIARRVTQIAAKSEGLPVAVQISAQKWRDNNVIVAMQTIEQHVRDDEHYPNTPVLKL